MKQKSYQILRAYEVNSVFIETAQTQHFASFLKQESRVLWTCNSGFSTIHIILPLLKIQAPKSHVNKRVRHSCIAIVTGAQNQKISA